MLTETNIKNFGQVESYESDSRVDDILLEADKKHCQESTSLPGEWREVKLECPGCTSDQFVYIYDDNKTCYCCQCDDEFDVGDLTGIEVDGDLSIEHMVSDDPAVVNQMTDRIIGSQSKSNLSNLSNLSLPGHQSKGGYSAYWEKDKQYSSFMNNCTHTPQHIIDGDGWGVWAGKKEDCRSQAKNFDVILNLTFTSIKEPHVIPIPELEQFAEVDCNYKEIQLDWPDYGVINMPREFWEKLLQYLSDNKLRMLVFCLGGHGRTGTALAVMMGMALNYTAEEAVNWLHRHYCFSAVETVGQENYVRVMLSPQLKELKDVKTLNPATQQIIRYVDKMKENREVEHGESK